jgi:pimeloyl-ACP methyl ester carboxylesterase
MILALILNVLIGLLIWNVVHTFMEMKSVKSIGYGKKVPVKKYNMCVNIIGEKNEIPIIILPGATSVAPVFEFKPLAEAFSSQYKVITVEPFGYGDSDVVKEERTLDNIVSDLHDCMEQLELKKYYIMGHSMSGIYSLAYANKYTEEVLGFIGIDASVPGIEETSSIGHSKAIKIYLYLMKLLNILGFKRFLLNLDPRSLILLDPNYVYTERELEIIKTLDIDKSCNATIMNFADHLDEMIASVHDMTFPEQIPVLNFISSENIQTVKNWEELHKQVVKEREHSELVILEGRHHLHLDNKDKIVEKVKEWII